MSDTHHLGEDLEALAAGGEGLEQTLRDALLLHSASCSSCQAALADTRAILKALGSAPALAPSASFDQALFHRLDALERSDREPLFAALQRFLFRPSLAFGAAFAIALLLLAGELLAPRPDTEAEVQMLAAALQGSDEEALEVAENLELLQNLDVIEHLDVIDDLDLLEVIDEVEAG